MKKDNKDKIEHELNYIKYIRGQIDYYSKQDPQDKEKIKEFKYKLSKALLIVKTLR